MMVDSSQLMKFLGPMFPDHLPIHLLCKYMKLRDIHTLRFVNRRFHKECNVEFFREFKRRLNRALLNIPLNLKGYIMDGMFLEYVLRDHPENDIPIQLYTTHLDLESLFGSFLSKLTIFRSSSTVTAYLENTYIVGIRFFWEPNGINYDGRHLTINTYVF